MISADKEVIEPRVPSGATNGAGTAYHSETHVFTPVFNGVRVAQSLVFSYVL
jgi:hypothetical protein